MSVGSGAIYTVQINSYYLLKNCYRIRYPMNMVSHLCIYPRSGIYLMYNTDIVAYFAIRIDERKAVAYC